MLKVELVFRWYCCSSQHVVTAGWSIAHNCILLAAIDLLHLLQWEIGLCTLGRQTNTHSVATQLFLLVFFRCCIALCVCCFAHWWAVGQGHQPNTLSQRDSTPPPAALINTYEFWPPDTQPLLLLYLHLYLYLYLYFYLYYHMKEHSC